MDGGQIPVFEMMTVTPAIQNMIRDGKTFQIDNVIYGGAASQAMLSMDNELVRLAREGRITRRDGAALRRQSRNVEKEIGVSRYACKENKGFA